jgi:cytochrome c-type biogenesis protein CcmH
VTRGSLAVAALVLSAAAVAAQGPPGPGSVPAPRSATETVDTAAQIICAPSGRAFHGPELDAEAKRIGDLLRCPVCQGLSITDSPSAMANNMRMQVRELLSRGYSESQILRYFERSYGEFVRLEPPLRGVNWIVWLAPGLGLLVGAALVLHMLRRPARRAEAAPALAPAPDEDPLPDEPELARYVLRVRELAHGWPGGVRPGKARS